MDDDTATAPTQEDLAARKAARWVDDLTPTAQTPEELKAKEASELRWAEHEARLQRHRSVAMYGLEGLSLEARATILGSEWRRKYRTRPPAPLRAIMTPSTAPKRQRRPAATAHPAPSGRRSSSTTKARAPDDDRPRLGERRCGCGCGRSLEGARPNKTYVDATHRVRAHREQLRSAAGAEFAEIEERVLQLRRAGRLDFEHAVLGAVVAHGVAA